MILKWFNVFEAQKNYGTVISNVHIELHVSVFTNLLVYTVRYSLGWRPLIKVAPPNTFCSFILKEYQIFKTAQLQTIMLELIKYCEFVIVIYVKLNEGTTCSEACDQ